LKNTKQRLFIVDTGGADMKKAILVFMIFSFMVFAGCEQTHDIKNNVLSRETQSNPAESNKAASE
jgi:hypothetical protein